MTEVLNAYKNAYHFGSTHVFFREYNPTLLAASLAYNSSGGQGATAGQFKVAPYGRREIHYQVRALVSASLAMSIQGRQDFMGTWTEIATIVTTAAQSNRMAVFSVTEIVDWMRVGVRAASPTGTDRVTIYGGFK